MLELHRNPVTYNYDVDISEDEWKEILSLPEVRNDTNILHALEQWYMVPNNTASCKMLSQLSGEETNFFSVQNRRLGEFAARHLGRFRLIGDDGKETYWAIPWIQVGKEKVDGVWIVRLRQELVEAIKSMRLFTKDLHSDVNDYLQNVDLGRESRFEFLHEQRENPLLVNKTIQTFPRDPNAAKNALLHGAFQCEYDCTHETFPRMSDGKPYMETHHLVPIRYAGRFPVSIDIPENIVCLCSTCHNRIHYGQDRIEMVRRLWNLREADLRAVGIKISITELIALYDKQQ